ncbi:MAG: hypothetical protein HY769_03435 [Candidatus Stahlbacteria bacterium]|nr:hypothetical protein [Candidatus Stahlbacteria bacterium]
MKKVIISSFLIAISTMVMGTGTQNRDLEDRIIKLEQENAELKERILKLESVGRVLEMGYSTAAVRDKTKSKEFSTASSIPSQDREDNQDKKGTKAWVEPTMGWEADYTNNYLYGVDNVGTYTMNVGIGTATPNNKLQVADLINFNNTLTSTYLGYQAGNATATGTNNMFSGYMAGNANTSGGSNTAIGTNALRSVTWGGSNTMIGTNAGYSMATGSNNVGIGAGVFGFVNGGNYNVAIGRSALSGNTANYNVAIGDNAMTLNNGGNNTAVGYRAGNEATGNSNTFIGHNTGLSVTGSCNTAVGREACVVATAGSNNVFMGYTAGYSNTGSNNTMLGQGAGSNSTSGTGNILIGCQAGDNITTGGYNLAIGYNIDAPVATSSNQLTIGNLIFGTGLDGTGTTISTGNIGIGTTGPARLLHVNGAMRLTAGSTPATPALGDIYANSTDNNLYFYNGTGWDDLTAGGGASDWHITGNADILDNSTYFLGTTNDIPLNFRVNNQKAGRVASGGPTFFGYQAGNVNTGVNNTGIGFQALSLNVGGVENTAVGYLALAANTGNYNTAVGRIALQNNTSGQQNTAMGIQALGKNTTGEYNTALGAIALYENLTGVRNTAIGTQALQNTTGHFNTGLGFRAIYGACTGNGNISIGYESSYSLTSGSNNIAIGYGTGVTNLSTGSNNILIGYNIDAQSAGISNQLSIGNLIFATGGFGTGTTVGAGNVGIGITSPGYKLDVNGDMNLAAGSVYRIGGVAQSGSSKWTAGAGDDIYRLNGKVGIGTTGPTQELHVFGTDGATLIRVGNTASGSTDADGVAFGYDDFAGGAIMWNRETTPVIFGVNNAEKVRITSNGDVGIGTQSPTSKLQVVGLPVYANNAAAIAGGLTVGAFYRTGADPDPDPVCVVH